MFHLKAELTGPKRFRRLGLLATISHPIWYSSVISVPTGTMLSRI